MPKRLKSGGLVKVKATFLAEYMEIVAEEAEIRQLRENDPLTMYNKTDETKCLRIQFHPSCCSIFLVPIYFLFLYISCSYIFPVPIYFLSLYISYPSIFYPPTHTVSHNPHSCNQSRPSHHSQVQVPVHHEPPES